MLISSHKLIQSLPGIQLAVGDAELQDKISPQRLIRIKIDYISLAHINFFVEGIVIFQNRGECNIV